MVAWDYQSRKHVQKPHTLYRNCICKPFPGTDLLQLSIFCAYHTAVQLLEKRPAGSFLFVKANGNRWEYEEVNRLLKIWGTREKMPNAKKLATQGCRRGIAAGRARYAMNLAEILEGGDWSAKTATYLKYMASAYGEVEARATHIALGQEEVSDDDA